MNLIPHPAPPEPPPFDAVSDEAPADARFAEALALFDAERYFEFHDVLEELWREEPGRERDFLQGLLQAGVSLHKARLGQLGGARKLFTKGRDRLAAFVPVHRGVEVSALLAAIERWLARAEERDRAGAPAWPDGTPPRIPRCAP